MLPAKNGPGATRIAALVTTGVVAQLQRIEKELGGRERIVGLLSLAPLTPDLQYLLGLLGDDRYRSQSLAQVCAIGNILPGTLLQQLEAAALARGKVIAAIKIGDGIGAVVDDVMRRAAPYEDACSECQGTATMVPEPTKEVPNPQPEPCETCRGTGRLKYRANEGAQRLAIDIARLLPKAAGIQIAQINAPGASGSNPGGSAGYGSLEQIQAMTDRLLYGGPAGGHPQAIDAEFTTDPDPDTPGGTPLPPDPDDGAE